MTLRRPGARLDRTTRPRRRAPLESRDRRRDRPARPANLHRPRRQRRTGRVRAVRCAALDASWAGRCVPAGTDRHRCATSNRRPGPTARDWSRSGSRASSPCSPPGEATKSFASAQALWDRLVAMKADRHACVVAVGGGVIGDLAGFVAATYARGVPLLMVPTTLLAQVDSSVGGKVGINHPDAKNIIGAFHQPVGVWIDTATLREPADPRAAVRAGRGGQVRRDPRRRLLRRGRGERRRDPGLGAGDPAADHRATVAGSRPTSSPRTSARRPACGPF